MFEVRVETHGGWALRGSLLRARQAAGVKRLAVGFEDAVYDNGVSIAQVALWNEFGTATIPERPFWRPALKRVRLKVRRLILARARKGIKPSYPYRHAGNDLLLAQAVADLIVKEVRKYIADLREPPNALATIRKKGFDDPLVWTGKLSDAVTSEIG